MTADGMKRDLPAPLRRLWKEAFGDTDAFLDLFARTAYSPARCRTLTDGTDVLAALYWFDCTVHGRRAAYLYAVATAKAHRGRGLCRTLMEDTHRHLAAHGYAYSILVPGDASLFQLYAKLGYKPFGGIREISCPAAEGDLPLSVIGGKEYARLRRQYLPDGAAVQEGENLAFLAAQASLYKGDGFLLAARREGAHLRGIELLGKTDACAQIVHVLGCQTGVFRTVGTDSFAMYRPLTKEALVPPSYFGLAFD